MSGQGKGRGGGRAAASSSSASAATADAGAGNHQEPVSDLDLDCMTILMDVCHWAVAGMQTQLAQELTYDFNVHRMAVAINPSSTEASVPQTAELDWAARLTYRPDQDDSGSGNSSSAIEWTFWRFDSAPLRPPLEVSFGRRRKEGAGAAKKQKRRADDHSGASDERITVLHVSEGAAPELLSRVFDQATAFFTMLARYPQLTAEAYRALCGHDLPASFMPHFLRRTAEYRQPDPSDQSSAGGTSTNSGASTSAAGGKDKRRGAAGASSSSASVQQQAAGRGNKQGTGVPGKRQSQQAQAQQMHLMRTLSAGVMAASETLSALASGNNNPMALDYIVEDEQRDKNGEDGEDGDGDVESSLSKADFGDQRIVTCTQGCNRSFTTMAGLRYHLQTYDHAKVRTIMCNAPGCSRTYTTMAGLRYHQKTVHRE